MITKIYHIADIHIRKGNQKESRYDEYLNVINNLINDVITSYTPNESICVICGDIFHHKLQISSYGIQLFYKLINTLADIIPTFVIQGNHDLIQEESDGVLNDMIKPLILNQRHPNIHYLNETQSFVFDNINFGVVSINDILQAGASTGMVDKLPLFPKPIPDKLNIALSHVTITNCSLHNYTKTTSGVSIEWFAGYNMVLLGDIHLQSVKYNKKHNIYYGYPGSLIQQDFGESIFNHGFLIWNIDKYTNNITVDKHHVHNSIGRANMKVSSNEIYINAENYKPLSEFFKYDKKPTKLHVRLYCNQEYEKYITEEMAQNGVECTIDVMRTCGASGDIAMEHTIDFDLTNLGSTDIIKEFMETNCDKRVLDNNPDWIDYIEQTPRYYIPIDAIYPEVILNKLNEKNTKLSKLIDCNISTNFVINKNTLHINNISFDWILPFGKHNLFKLDCSGVTLINAPNGYGKSAFFECIVIALFGEPIPSRYNKTTSLSLINKKKPFNCDTSRTEIRFMLNGSDYTIKRYFYEHKDNKNTKRLLVKNVELYLRNDRIKTGSTVVNKWVQEHICSIKDFLLSTMITQNFDFDFFKFKTTDQIELLDNMLHMEDINIFTDLIKLARKEYKDLRNHVETFLQTLKPTHEFSEIEYLDAKQSLNHITDKILSLRQQDDNLEVSIKNFKDVKHNPKKKPTEDLSELLALENQLHNQINKQGIDFQENMWYDVTEFNLDRFREKRFDILPSSCLTFDYTISIKDRIVQLNKLDSLYYEIAHKHCILLAKRPIKYDIDDYNSFQHKFDRYHRLCAHIQQVEEPTLPDGCDHLIHKSLEDLQILLECTSNQMINTEYHYNETCWACNKNFNCSNKTDIEAVLMYKKNMKLWKRYLKYKEDVDTYLELCKEKNYWDTIQPKIRAYQEWCSSFDVIEKEHNQLQQQIVDTQYILSQSHIFQQKHNIVHELYVQLEAVVKKKQYYILQKVHIREELNNLYTQEKMLVKTITKHEVSYHQHKTYTESQSNISSLLEYLKNKIELFDSFVENFKQFKSWIYNVKLLPSIVNKANSILEKVFLDRVILLQFEFVENTMLFTVKDEGNDINIEKLSGAQSFAVSLSFRLALSLIGFSKLRCDQLFIDEGFCSFDQNNLENVPVLISNLNQIYDEIILVTHLDQIKNCAKRIINIKRNNGISYISN